MEAFELRGGGPWPLDRTELESPVPQGLVLDISLCGSPEAPVYLDTLVWGPAMWGLCLSTTGRAPLAWVWSSSEPEAGAPMALVCVDGWAGSVVFGRHPEPFSLMDIGRALDPRCLAFPPASPFSGGVVLVVDGVEHTLPPGGELVIRGAGYLTTSLGAGGFTLGRADVLLDSDAKWRLFQDSADLPPEVKSINGAFPDSGGNLDIMVEGVLAQLVYERPAIGPAVPIGVALDGGSFQTCLDASPLKTLIKCRTELGIDTPLPLDYVRCPDIGVPVCD